MNIEGIEKLPKCENNLWNNCKKPQFRLSPIYFTGILVENDLCYEKIISFVRAILKPQDISIKREIQKGGTSSPCW
jgi:hypothetical protein